MSHCTIHPQEKKMTVYTTRRPSTMSVASSSSGRESDRRPSVADNRRRSSLASLSLRLTKSKRSRASTSTATQEATYLPCPSNPSARQLGSLFFSLPPEIQSLVLSHLPLPTIFSLRLTSRTALSLLHANAPDISRSVLTSSPSLIPPQHLSYIQSLYPPPTPHNSTNYALQLLHRHHSIQNVLVTIVTYIQMKIYMIRSSPRVEHFGPYRGRLVQRLYPSAWTVYHYLESYRNILVHEHPHHHHPASASPSNPHTTSPPSPSKFWPFPICADLFNDLVDSYPASRILPAYHFYALLLHHLKASSRAPTYAGTLERKLRGWSRKQPTEEELSIVVVLGGMSRMAGKNFSVMRGTYNARLEVLGGFVDSVENTARAAAAAGMPMAKAAKAAEGKQEVVESSSYTPGRRARFSSSSGSMMEELATPWNSITSEVLETLPHIDDFLIQDFQRRILEEELLAELRGEGNGDESEVETEMVRQRELASPFAFVRRLMVEVDEEREREREGERECVRGREDEEGEGRLE